MKLLIVDDNGQTRAALRVICSSVADDIHEATDGGDAIRACEEQRPDWVLMDIKMRPMNGLVATQKILERWPQVRVVVLTGHDDPETRHAAHEAGACAFLSKDRLMDVPKLLSQKPMNQS
jgi:DNA-binding NarL/FixJ family response regulator